MNECLGVFSHSSCSVNFYVSGHGWGLDVTPENTRSYKAAAIAQLRKIIYSCFDNIMNCFRVFSKTKTVDASSKA